MSIEHFQAHDGISITNPTTKWNDIVGFERAKDVLDAEIVLPIKLPHLFEGRRQPCNPVLLYGPHEKDKSCLAEAAAGEAGVKLFSAVGSPDGSVNESDTGCVCFRSVLEG